MRAKSFPQLPQRRTLKESNPDSLMKRSDGRLGRCVMKRLWLGTQNTACTGAHTNDDVKTTANMDILKVGLDFKLSN